MEEGKDKGKEEIKEEEAAKRKAGWDGQLQ
jgi:hypothetical protein